jgi:hypothetical protein
MVLAMTVHSRVKRFRLMSRCPDGRWVVTTDAGGEPDISGLGMHEYLPTYFPYVLEYHYRRLGRLNVTPVPFDPSTAVDDLCEHDRQRAGVLHAAGLARWRDVGQSAWSYSFRGALRVTLAALSGMFSVGEARRLVQAEGFPLKK